MCSVGRNIDSIPNSVCFLFRIFLVWKCNDELPLQDEMGRRVGVGMRGVMSITVANGSAL
jgi:hypothetical protein